MKATPPIGHQRSHRGIRSSFHVLSTLVLVFAALAWPAEVVAGPICGSGPPIYWPPGDRSSYYVPKAPLPANHIIAINFNRSYFYPSEAHSRLPLQLVDDIGQTYPLEPVWSNRGWGAQADFEQLLLRATLPLTPGRRVWLIAHWGPELIRLAEETCPQGAKDDTCLKPRGCWGLPKEVQEKLSSKAQGEGGMKEGYVCAVLLGAWAVTEPAAAPQVQWSGEGSLAYALQDPDFGWAPGSWGLAVKTSFTLSPAYEGLEPWQTFPLPLWVRLWHPALPTQPYDFYVQEWEPGPCVDFWTGPCRDPIWPMPPGPFEVELGLLLPDGNIAWWPHGRVLVPGMETVLYTEVPEEPVDAAGCPLQRPSLRLWAP